MNTNKKKNGRVIIESRWIEIIEKHKNIHSRGDINTGPLPWKLHKTLNICEKEGLDHTVSWLPGDIGFKVHNTENFVKYITKIFFRQTKYKSGSGIEKSGRCLFVSNR
mmetsp:Transcript_26246/g.57498  ORF Transcript_26246/g.57498 Transcript_26246/m.57498 type:complete len:108 (-) Transcript_26246:1114-1437(-)